ncbi:MAG: phage baseplate assembly protein V [Anaerolineales bacterium]
MTDRDMEQLTIQTAEFLRNRFFGKYRGIVQDVEDPETMGRIVARVPEIFGETDLPWALPSVPFAGADHGLVVLPEVDDGVWIEFEAGDPSRPIWSGCWWASGEMPSPGGKDTRVLVTSGGHQLVLDDDANEIKLVHAGGAELKMSDSELSIKIGSTQIVLSSSGASVNNGSLEVK